MEGHDLPFENPALEDAIKTKSREELTSAACSAAQENRFHYHRSQLHSFNFLEAMSAESQVGKKGAVEWTATDGKVHGEAETKETFNISLKRSPLTLVLINHPVLIV